MTARHVAVDAALLDGVPAPYRRFVVVASTDDVLRGAAPLAAQLRDAAAHASRAHDPEALTTLPSVRLWREAFAAHGIPAGKYWPRRRRSCDGRWAVTTSRWARSSTPAPPWPCATTCRWASTASTGCRPGTSGSAARPAKRSSRPFRAPPNDPPGEVVYTVGRTVLTRRWVWRQGPVGSVHAAGGARLAVKVDVLGDVDEGAVLEDLHRMLDACGATTSTVLVLDTSCPRAALPG